MPRKCNVKSIKQKNLQRRLMQIQICIENYVYNGKKISASDASGYLEEVTGYRAQGIQDARFLQVIEKITRCMKGILEEQKQESDSDNTNCSSPVYSLPDEDKMLLSQAPMNIDATDNLNDTTDLFEEDSVALQQNLRVDVEIHRAMSGLSIREDEIQIFEQCSQSILHNLEPEKLTGKLGTPNPIQMEFQRKTAQDLNSNNFNFSDHNSAAIAAQKLATNKCFQSILQNLEPEKLTGKLGTPKPIEIEFQKKTTQDLNSNNFNFSHHNSAAIATQKSAINNVLNEDDDVIFIEPTQLPTQHSMPEVVGILKTPKTNFKCNQEFTNELTPSLNSNSSIISDHSTLTQPKLAIKNVHFRDTNVMFVEPNPTIAKTRPIMMQEITQNGTEKKTRRKQNLNKNANKNETNKRKTRIDGNTKRVKKTDSNVKNSYQKQIQKSLETFNNINALHTSTNDHNHSDKSIAKVIQNPANIVDFHKRNELNGKIHKRKTKNNKKTVKIYNKSTENDLSWIENIRYVREVTNEEFEHAFFEESFWENLMFPSDWNDKDFDY